MERPGAAILGLGTGSFTGLALVVEPGIRFMDRVFCRPYQPLPPPPPPPPPEEPPPPLPEELPGGDEEEEREAERLLPKLSDRPPDPRLRQEEP
jgi:hypothetical protein